jgi:hypothetical protein
MPAIDAELSIQVVHDRGRRITQSWGFTPGYYLRPVALDCARAKPGLEVR